MENRGEIMDENERMIETLTSLIASVFGPDVFDDGPRSTAERVLRFWREYAPRTELNFNPTTFKAPANNLVICKDIEFSSMCAHHLLPFYGKAHIGYIPTKLAIGLSKMPRVVDHFASRPQMQERLTEEIARWLKDTLSAMGVIVVIEARHTCMACRGVRKHNGVMITSSTLGLFLTSQSAKQEFLDLIGRNQL